MSKQASDNTSSIKSAYLPTETHHNPLDTPTQSGSEDLDPVTDPCMMTDEMIKFRETIASYHLKLLERMADLQSCLNDDNH